MMAALHPKSDLRSLGQVIDRNARPYRSDGTFLSVRWAVPADRVFTRKNPDLNALLDRWLGRGVAVSSIVPLAEAIGVSRFGGKANALAEVLSLGLPVPLGFVIAAEVQEEIGKQEGRSRGHVSETGAQLAVQLRRAWEENIGSSMAAVRSSACWRIQPTHLRGPVSQCVKRWLSGRRVRRGSRLLGVRVHGPCVGLYGEEEGDVFERRTTEPDGGDRAADGGRGVCRRHLLTRSRNRVVGCPVRGVGRRAW